MSRSELLEAYVSGRIGRRAFIRGLLALGIALDTAVLHAVALRPASAAPWDDFYNVDGPRWATAGNGGTADASANGGAVAVGDINSGANSGNAIGVGDTSGDVAVDGGAVANSTTLDITVDGGTAIADASGGDDNEAFLRDD